MKALPTLNGYTIDLVMHQFRRVIHPGTDQRRLEIIPFADPAAKDLFDEMEALVIAGIDLLVSYTPEAAGAAVAKLCGKDLDNLDNLQGPAWEAALKKIAQLLVRAYAASLEETAPQSDSYGRAVIANMMLSCFTYTHEQLVDIQSVLHRHRG